jgi:hypothetical protein
MTIDATILKKETNEFVFLAADDAMRPIFKVPPTARQAN